MCSIDLEEKVMVGAETGTAGRGRIEFIKEGERFDPQTGYVYQRNRNTVVL